MLALLALLFQAALPPPGTTYFARTEYSGPGLVCGSAFAVTLENGETAVLQKPSAINAEYSFNTRNGTFSIRESQNAQERGVVVKRLPEGVLRRKFDNGRFLWIYRDNAPGSTDVFGPAVNARSPSKALSRIRFGAVRYRKVDGKECLPGDSTGLSAN